MIQYIRNLAEFLEACERSDNYAVAERIECIGEFTVSELELIESVDITDKL